MCVSLLYGHTKDVFVEGVETVRKNRGNFVLEITLFGEVPRISEHKQGGYVFPFPFLIYYRLMAGHVSLMDTLMSL